MPESTPRSYITSRSGEGTCDALCADISAGSWPEQPDELCLSTFIPPTLASDFQAFEQSTIPKLARDQSAIRSIEAVLPSLPTRHLLRLGDSRTFTGVADESVHLIVTSPPYWTLKQYPRREGQLGAVEDYEEFNRQLDSVWSEARRVLVPGGRLVVVVGDVNLARRRHGRHVVMPLHASIQEHCRRAGLDNLAPIIWQKIANASYEAGGQSAFLGKPYEPNAVIKNDIEYILFQRKPGGYRQPSKAARLLSLIPEASYQLWFRQVWSDINGASTREHPAPYPFQLAERLIRMFSFVGDTVLDPFLGTGTTSIAAAQSGRNSIGFDIEPTFLRAASERLRAFAAQGRLLADPEVSYTAASG